MSQVAVIAAFPQAESALRAYAHWLSNDGVERGIIGPREADRVWDRHISNCAAMAELLPQDSQIVDIGSGAGLPGLVLAIVRPDVKVTLIEPLQRRCDFLNEVISDLKITDRVKVLRGRAQDFKGINADVVTARAVAPLAKLLTWALPLTKKGGEVLAMKGASAEQEIIAAKSVLSGRKAEILRCGQAIVEPLTTVVRVVS